MYVLFCMLQHNGIAFIGIEDVVRLVHAWLKENHLLKTTRTLGAEYGKVNIPLD